MSTHNTMSSKADEALTSHFEKVTKAVEKYGRTIDSLLNLLNMMMIRFNAFVSPTSDNRLKAISIPSMTEIGKEIVEVLKEGGNMVSSIKTITHEIDLILTESSVKCGDCGGYGRIRKPTYVREDRMITPVVEWEPCVMCKGTGRLPLSEDMTLLAKEIMKDLSTISKEEFL